MVEEDKRNKRPANWESRKRKVEWEIAEEEARKVWNTFRKKVNTVLSYLSLSSVFFLAVYGYSKLS